jgi:hypothetical protein
MLEVAVIVRRLLDAIILEFSRWIIDADGISDRYSRVPQVHSYQQALRFPSRPSSQFPECNREWSLNPP